MTRRAAAARMAALLLGAPLVTPAHANAKSFEEGMNRYVKKKVLDDIDTYVPSVLLTRIQYASIADVVASDAPAQDRAATCRDLLRDGPAAAMRDNIRAVARYAVQEGSSQGVQETVDGILASYFKAIDTIDSNLFQAKRSGKLDEKTVSLVTSSLATALEAIDQLVALLPVDVVQRGEKVVKANSFRQDLFRDATEEESVNVGEFRNPDRDASEANDPALDREAPAAPKTLKVDARLF